MLSPSTCTTRPSTGGNAATTSWSIRPKVAPTWSAMPACAGPARVKTKNKVSAVVTRPLTISALASPLEASVSARTANLSPSGGEGFAAPPPSGEGEGWGEGGRCQHAAPAHHRPPHLALSPSGGEG